jgi:hypothetical protein
LFLSKHCFSQSIFMAVNAQGNESTKIPLFYNQTDRDTLHPKTWLDRCDQAAVVQGWSDAQKIMAASFALRGYAETWYQIEIRDLENPTWELFKEKFLGLTLHESLPYRGGQIWPQILNAYKEPTVTAHYLKLASNMILFHQTLPAFVHDTQFESPATRAMPGIAALTPAEKQAFAHDVARRATRVHMNTIAMSVFFCNQSQEVKDFLLARAEYSDLVALKNAVEAFSSSRKNGTAVNAVEDVDAIRRRQATRNAKPEQARKNVTCFYCNKKGHGQQECRKRARDGADMVKPPPRPQGQQHQGQGQHRSKVNETAELQQVQSAFQSHLYHLN